MSLSKECHPNGVRKACKVPIREAGFRQASEYVAAIDFGSTYCSLAYTLQGNKEILKFELDGAHVRVPNAILISEKKSNKVVKFGYRAQNMFAQLPKTDRYIYRYFERMKIYRTPDVNRHTPISPVNSSEQYYLVDVVAFILKYLKDQLYEYLGKSDLNMSHVQFDWVVTVPAIWDAQGKQMMREAAYLAGLCSSPPSCELIPYHGSRKLDMPVENAPDRLSLVLEPTAVALCCYNSREHYLKPKHFTIVDAGKTNVNITSYYIDQYGHICVVDKASGNDWGGTRVNDEFAQFLETIVEDPGFTRYISVSDPQKQQLHKADLNKLIYGEFELQKNIFGDEDDDTRRIASILNIPNSFMKFYKAEKLEAVIESQYSDVAELDGSQLTIEPHKMKQFFQPAIDQICQSAFEALKRVQKEVEKLEAIYLIGEFGACRLMKTIMRDKLQARYGPELNIFVPIDHRLTTACGAVIFRRNPKVVWLRKAEATYGDIFRVQFSADLHDPAHKVIDERGESLCDSLFRPYIEVGDSISADEVLQVSCMPFESNQTKLPVTVYSSAKRDLWYAKDTSRELVAELAEVGTLVFDLRDIPGRSKFDKKIVLTIDLSETEMHLRAHHETTGKEVKVVFDTVSLKVGHSFMPPSSHQCSRKAMDGFDTKATVTATTFPWQSASSRLAASTGNDTAATPSQQLTSPSQTPSTPLTTGNKMGTPQRKKLVSSPTYPTSPTSTVGALSTQLMKKAVSSPPSSQTLPTSTVDTLTATPSQQLTSPSQTPSTPLTTGNKMAATPSQQLTSPSQTPSTPLTTGNKMGTPQRKKLVSSPPSYPASTTSTVDTLVVKDVCEITEYLLDLEKKHITLLGLELGLTHPKLKDMEYSTTFREDVITAWVRMEDNVIEKGEPSWAVLASALRQRRVGQTGIARKIEKDKGL